MKKSAFTLVELIIVITILAILRTIGFMSYSSYVSDARDTSRVITIKSIQSGINMYFSMTSSLPNPDNALTLSGGTGAYIKQGIIGKSVSSTIKLIDDVKDPKTNKEYVYSISGNGNYYQIGADLENAISYNNFANTAYAEQTKAYVKGNYSFDPSLPSLITITGSVNSSSGIFDPNVCFVIDGGTNLISSTSGTCTAKYKMSLKDYDSSLVGYWDMETYFQSGGLYYIKDLTNNGNDGIFSGGMSPITAGTLTGGIIGKGIYFNGTTGKQINIKPSSTLNFVGKEISVSAIIKTSSSTGMSIFTQHNFGNGGSGSLFLLRTYSGGISGLPCINFDIAESQAIHQSYTYYNGVITNSTNYWNTMYSDCNSNMKNISDNYSHFVVGVVSSTSRKWYVDGIKEFEVSSNYSLPSSLYDLSIGGEYNGDAQRNNQSNFLGTIDDIKIYNRVLTDQEIAQQAKIAGF